MYHSIGIDVAKQTLQVYIPFKDENIRIKNTSKAIKSLYSKLKKYYKKELERVVFVFEPTSTYSSSLKYFCAQKSIKAFIVNPRQSANFAKAIDSRSKTDVIDSKLLSQMLITADEKNICVPIIDEVQERIKELLTYYKLLQKQRNAVSNYLEALAAKDKATPLYKKLLKECQRLKLEEETVIEEILEIIRSDERLSQSFNNITSIVGVGDLSGIALLHLFITYPEANRQQISALSGLDAVEKTSGTSLNKKTRISKRGSSIYRGILFMPVLVSVRMNPYFKAFYERLLSKGKHTTVAQIAVMRKTILIAHSLYKNNQVFDNKVYEKRIAWNKEENEMSQTV